MPIEAHFSDEDQELIWKHGEAACLRAFYGNVRRNCGRAERTNPLFGVGRKIVAFRDACKRNAPLIEFHASTRGERDAGAGT